MAKRKHPTAKDLRQGQTVYMVYEDPSQGFPAIPKIEYWFLYSHKEPLPPSCCVVKKKPVTWVKELLRTVECNSNFYYSHKRALTAFNKLRDSYKIRLKYV